MLCLATLLNPSQCLQLFERQYQLHVQTVNHLPSFKNKFSLTTSPKRAELTTRLSDVHIFLHSTQQMTCCKLLHWLFPGRGIDTML